MSEKSPREAIRAMRNAIDEGLKHGGLVRLIEWLDDEYYGGAVSEMSEGEQAVVYAFTCVIDALLWEHMRELQVSLLMQNAKGGNDETE